MEDEEFLTVLEAAARLKVHPETVRVWLRSGRLLKGVVLSRAAGWRIPESEVLRLLNPPRARPAEETR